MSNGFELYQSRVSYMEVDQGSIAIHFPHASIYKAKGTPGRDPGATWSQEAELLMEDATVQSATALLPNMIDDGYFEVDGERYEVIPLPLGEHETGHLHLVFTDGTTLDVEGRNPIIKLIGRAIRLEDFS